MSQQYRASIKKIPKILSFCFVLFLFSFNIVQAGIDVDINVKDVFNYGETVYFDYKILSDTDESVEYIEHIQCPGSIETFPKIQELDLKAFEIHSGKYTYAQVDDNIVSAQCTASITIDKPRFRIHKKNFNVISKKEMNFSLKSCEKSNCEKYKKMYLKDDKVYIDYDSDVSDIAINATLTFPDKTTQQIQFPYSFKAKQLGTHTIEAEATKQGHKTITEKYEFGVIKEHANVESAQICNADNKCSDKETYQNCPQDCKKGEIAKTSKTIFNISLRNIIIILGIILIIAAAISLFLYFRSRDHGHGNTEGSVDYT